VARVALALRPVPAELAVAPEAVGLARPVVGHGRLTESRAPTLRRRPRIECDPGASADVLRTIDPTLCHQLFRIIRNYGFAVASLFRRHQPSGQSRLSNALNIFADRFFTLDEFKRFPRRGATRSTRRIQWQCAQRWCRPHWPRFCSHSSASIAPVRRADVVPDFTAALTEDVALMGQSWLHLARLS
jgi:hypothetical protein